LAKRQQAAAQSSLTDRINLSIAEAFVNGGSLTAMNLYIRRGLRKLLSRRSLRKIAPAEPDA